jgi:hypothetical protein
MLKKALNILIKLADLRVMSVAKATVIMVTIGLLYVRTIKGSNDCRIVDA